ncbi:MAG TPA: hypothetical protein VN887_06940, partial [Candidatus Angelobacter sp.]|nr:hypothetical protein [Candidatus Angelobacter sp.]
MPTNHPAEHRIDLDVVLAAPDHSGQGLDFKAVPSLSHRRDNSRQSQKGEQNTRPGGSRNPYFSGQTVGKLLAHGQESILAFFGQSANAKHEQSDANQNTQQNVRRLWNDPDSSEAGQGSGRTGRYIVGTASHFKKRCCDSNKHPRLSRHHTSPRKSAELPQQTKR